jgi:hypothetical protein
MQDDRRFELVLEALKDERVLEALRMAMRDAAIRRDFERLREDGLMVREAVSELAGCYYLSRERIRDIVYEKG